MSDLDEMRRACKRLSRADRPLLALWLRATRVLLEGNEHLDSGCALVIEFEQFVVEVTDEGRLEVTSYDGDGDEEIEIDGRGWSFVEMLVQALESA